MINSVVGVEFDKEGIKEFINTLSKRPEYQPRDAKKQVEDTMPKEYVFKLTVENLEGKYTIEKESNMDGIFDLFGEVIEPMILMMGYTNESINDYYAEMATLNEEKPND